GATARELERDGPAEAVAGHVRPVQAERPQLRSYGRDQLGHGPGRTRRRRRRAAEARHVQRDDLVMAGEQVQHGLPRLPSVPDAVQQDERLAGPTPLVVQRWARGGALRGQGGAGRDAAGGTDPAETDAVL